MIQTTYFQPKRGCCAAVVVAVIAVVPAGVAGGGGDADHGLAGYIIKETIEKASQCLGKTQIEGLL